MFQIDNSSAVSQMPAPSAAGAQGYFTDGNPATGEAATILPAEFMNMLMMELMSVVQAGSITPDKTKTNQVLSALNALFAPQSAFANSKAANGYQKLQGGLILQWGYFTGAVTGPYSVTFPLQFPNAIYGVYPTSIATQTSGNYNNQWVNSSSTTGFTGYKDTTSSMFWFAIGQ